MEKDVSTPSLDYEAMLPFWDKVEAVLGGTEAMRQQKQYLPKFPHESDSDYQFRLSNAKFTNVFRDIAENLAAKPFAEELALKEDASKALQDFAEDVDGCGNSQHVFAANAFYRGIADAVHWIFVDYTSADGELRTVAEEKAAGVRPYWISLTAKDVIAVETAVIKGLVSFTHLRFWSNYTVREGFEEKTVERIFEYNRLQGDNGEYTAPFVTTWEKRKADNQQKEEWQAIGEPMPLTIDEIPLVPFISTRRKGKSWQYEPMLQDAADLQIELFQQESALKYAKDNTAFPMLAGNGVSPATDEKGNPVLVPVGPKTVLYAPANGEGDHGEWKFIEPSAQSLKFLAEDVKETISQLRELGRQPLTAQTGNLTVVTTAFAAQKGNSAVMAAALLLKDALENAWRLTAKWMALDERPKVEIFTDFDVTMDSESGNDALSTARANGDLSQRTYWAELQRRNILSPNFDPDDEEDALNNELPGDAAEADVSDALPGSRAADLDRDAA